MPSYTTMILQIQLPVPEMSFILVLLMSCNSRVNSNFTFSMKNFLIVLLQRTVLLCAPIYLNHPCLPLCIVRSLGKNVTSLVCPYLLSPVSPSPMRPVPYNWFLLCEIPTVLAVSWLDFVDCYLCQWTGVSMSSSPCWCPAQNLFARQVNPTYDCTVGSWMHSSPENCPCPQILVDSQVVQW